MEDLEKEFELGYNGNIAIIWEASFAIEGIGIGIEMKNQSELQEWRDERVFEFDEVGNLVRMVYHKPSLVPFRTWEYGISNTEMQTYGLKRIDRKLQYDDVGKILSEQVVVQSPTEGYEVPEGIDTTEIITIIDYSYNIQGLLRQKTERASNGIMIGDEHFEYNKKGYLSTYSKGDFSIEDWCEFKYDEDGILIEKHCSRPAEQVRRITRYEYLGGILTKEILEIYVKGEEGRTIICSYNDGYVETIKHFNINGETLEKLDISYVFDKRGNWIWKEMEGLNSRYLVKREITYRE